jgi:UDP-N-acetylmuramate--alanine ligase
MKRIHLIGIGGSGLSAIALLLQEMGYTVTGSDRADSPFLQELRLVGVTIHIGHSPENVAGADLVMRSSAIPDDNPEVQAARAAGIPVLKRADFLGQLMAGKTGIAIAGTHGKTTTTAMLAWALSELGQDPSFIIGGVLSNLGINARAGKGPHFVIEADEYDRMFLGLKPTIEIVTNIEHDHPDCYPTAQDFEDAFEQFARLLPENGTLVVCADDPGAAGLAAEVRETGKQVVTYGLSIGLGVYAENIKSNQDGGFSFDAIVLGFRSSVDLQVPGQHNIRNALAVLAVVSLLGLDVEGASRALGTFKGSGRRFEVKGKANGITIVDDYAHHPTEIRATLAAARARYPQARIWAVWQPHTYSRTQTLFTDFIQAFGDADQVIVSEVYKAREPQQDFSAEQVVKAMSHPAAHFIAGLADIQKYLFDHLRPGDVLLVLSAGDADLVSRNVLAQLEEREVPHG